MPRKKKLTPPPPIGQQIAEARQAAGSSRTSRILS